MRFGFREKNRRERNIAEPAGKIKRVGSRVIHPELVAAIGGEMVDTAVFSPPPDVPTEKNA
jgi:hypothetical protein